MRKPSQFLEYSYIIFIFPGLREIVLYNGKDLSFEQFSRIIVQYLKEKHKNEFDFDSPDNTLINMTVKGLYEDFSSWWDKLSVNKKNFIVSCGINMTDWFRKKICPRCESGTLRQGKAQKIEKQWKYPTTCSNKNCSLHNNTLINLVLSPVPDANLQASMSSES